VGGLGARSWLTWSWRDLRRRWALVLAIGLLLAGGTGLAAGLGSMEGWRIDSNDRSFGALSVHDLRIDVEEGGYAPAGALSDAAAAIPAADSVADVAEQLVAPTQIDASAVAPGPVLTPGQLIGVEPGENRVVDGVDVTGPAVDAIAVEQGSGLGSGAGAILDPFYAEENGITLSGTIGLAGGAELELVGLGRSPETFVVTGPGGAFSAAEDFGTVFVPLTTAQELLGREGKVNGLALTLLPGADRDEVATQLERSIRRRLPGLGVQLSEREELDSHRILYDDAENDQQLFNVFAFLILAGST
jgi:putative ABC transport system permease protein